ncbi:MAG TPA: peptidogalycan biosysnthesis protein, partial [Candidatus Udaeobacter sp.]|nr:peptidogalycan biosysnthesis protein [Candidatus Udaeobacter sp.]
MIDNARVKIIRKISEVCQNDWDRLLGNGSPFLKWDWLNSLETTGCVNEETGWLPHHFIVERHNEVIAACPMYLKLHSMGEFVFDYEWAEAAHRLGLVYYPKMLVGVPFTPVTGQRFLTADGADRGQLIRLIGKALAKAASDNKISSVHVNFCLEEEREALENVGFMSRMGLQFQWQNGGFASFDDYLRSFRSDRRNKIKRERREVAQKGIVIRAIQGEELTQNQMRTMFRLYKSHVDRLYYGRQYLTQDFFEQTYSRMAAHICLMLAQREGK